MDAQYLTDQYPQYTGQISYFETIPSQPPDSVPATTVLSPKLASHLDFDLYKHQADALTELEQGNDVCITTSTASGKTLIYALQIAKKIEENPNSRALLLYPTKALSRDQANELTDLYNRLNLDVDVGVYDGDVGKAEKKRVREESNVIITNFAGLNYYLPHHPSWTTFFSNLDTLVIDEAHTYAGVQGMHVAWMLRRLLRIVSSRTYASNPQLILTSATIGNPIEHCHNLTGRTVSLIDTDGSPQSLRDLIIWNPPTYEGKDGNPRRKSTHREAAALLAHLTNMGAQTLLFVPSRRMSELCAKWTTEILKDKYGRTDRRIEPYHAGHTKQERHTLEKSLKNNELAGVVTTPALEVGIDIGSVDAVLISGYPGSRMSFWQQIGRAGRRNRGSLALLIAQNDSIDQYIVNNPNYLLETENIEDAIIDLSNKPLLKKHLVVAARESPLRNIDKKYFGENYEALVKDLIDDGKLSGHLGDKVYYAEGKRPEAAINLYSTSSLTATVKINSHGSETELPPADISRAYREFHEGAIYLHKGNTYKVTEFNTNGKTPTVILEPSNASYHTQAARNVEITSINSQQKVKIAPGLIAHKGTGTIKEYYPTYTKIYENGKRESGYDTGNTRPLTITTDMLWLEVTDETYNNIQTVTNDSVLASMHAAEHALIKMAPTALTVDSADLGGISTSIHPETGKPTLFIYDGLDGGLGFSHRMYDRIDTLSHATADMIRDCICEQSTGCPACVMDNQCGNNNTSLDKPGAITLLRTLENPPNDSEN